MDTKSSFSTRVISCKSSTPWPAQSPNLNPSIIVYGDIWSAVVINGNAKHLDNLMGTVKGFRPILSEDQILNATS